MQVDAVRLEGRELILTLPAPSAEARRLVYKFKPGNWEVTRKAKKRSLDANSKMWAVCTEIANAIGITKEEVYRKNIRDVGCYTPLPIRADAVDAFKKAWESAGTGWVCDIVDDSKIEGYKLVFAYPGSSTYDVPQMARLIDAVNQEAHSLGIDTMPEEERRSLLQEWEERSRAYWEKRLES